MQQIVLILRVLLGNLIAIYYLQLTLFTYARYVHVITLPYVYESSHAEKLINTATPDTTQTGLSCRVWCDGVN